MSNINQEKVNHLLNALLSGKAVGKRSPEERKQLEEEAQNLTIEEKEEVKRQLHICKEEIEKVWEHIKSIYYNHPLGPYTIIPLFVFVIIVIFFFLLR